MQHFGAGRGDQLRETLAAKFGRMDHALPAAFSKLGKSVLEAGRGGDDAVFPAAGRLVAGPVQRRNDAFAEFRRLFEHGLGGVQVVVFKAGQGADLGQAGEFLHGKQHVFQGGLVAHGVLS